jgi:hypothetical protein
MLNPFIRLLLMLPSLSPCTLFPQKRPCSPSDLSCGWYATSIALLASVAFYFRLSLARVRHLSVYSNHFLTSVYRLLLI